MWVAAPRWQRAVLAGVLAAQQAAAFVPGGVARIPHVQLPPAVSGMPAAPGGRLDGHAVAHAPEAGPQVSAQVEVELEELCFAGRPASAAEARVVSSVLGACKGRGGWLGRLGATDVLRFTRSVSRNVKAADDEELSAAVVARLEAAQAWRDANRADGILEEKEFSIDTFWQVHKPGGDAQRELEWLSGTDHRQRPTLLFFADRHLPGEMGKGLWERFVIYNAEDTIAKRGVANGPGGQFSLVVDRTSSGLRNQDPKLAVSIVRKIVKHYPDLLGQVYVAPVNTVFYGIWKVLKLFLSEDAKSKFVLIRGSDWREKLQAAVGGDVQLPPYMLPGATDADKKSAAAPAERE